MGQVKVRLGLCVAVEFYLILKKLVNICRNITVEIHNFGLNWYTLISVIQNTSTKNVLC